MLVMSARGLCFSLLLSVLCVLSGCPSVTLAAKKIDVAAYYFGDWHVDPFMSSIHGPNWTEWRLVEYAVPKFPGHQQPKTPLWGFQTNENTPEGMAQKINAAAKYGVDVFIFDWYWYNKTGSFLNGALDDGFLNAPNLHKIQFAIHWCTQPWLDLHPSTWHSNANQEVLIPAVWTFENVSTVWDLIIHKYMSHPNYYILNGCKYISIYQLWSMIQTLGPDQTKAAFKLLRTKAAAAGFCVHIDSIDQGLYPLGNASAALIDYDFDSVASYCFIHNVGPNFPVNPYMDMVERTKQYWNVTSTRYSKPYIPNVAMAWDSSPRTSITDAWENIGYPYGGLFEAEPAEFQSALQSGKQFVEETCIWDRCLLTINAWNEWSEGARLEPDTLREYGYLEAVQKVFGHQ